MKKLIKYLLLLIPLVLLTSCDLFNMSGNNKSENKYDTELLSSSGNWYLLDDNNSNTDTYFEFDGSNGKMTFKYYETNTLKYNGSYSVVAHDNDGTNASSVTFIINRSGYDKEEYIYTYVDDFKTNFTQFTIIKEECDEGMDDGRIYAHIYRISELPYKLGTYLKEGSTYKTELNNYRYKSYYQVPEGTYTLDNDTSITFVMKKPYSYALFQYRSGSNVLEGVYFTATDKKTIYLYIDHDPYQHIKRADRDSYDMTFSADYPPDFYLRGNFSVENNGIVIESLYHHEYSKTTINDKVFKFGTYTRRQLWI